MGWCQANFAGLAHIEETTLALVKSATPAVQSFLHIATGCDRYKPVLQLRNILRTTMFSSNHHADHAGTKVQSKQLCKKTSKTMNAKETQNILNNHIPKQRVCKVPSLVMLFFTRTFHGEPSLAGHREASQDQKCCCCLFGFHMHKM